jgi:hypothetical protein
MVTFLALFVLGSFWWYSISVCYVVWAIFLAERESVGWVLTSLAIYLIFLSFLGRVNVFSYIFYNPLYSFLAVISYFVFGIIWSFVKWWLRVTERAQECQEAMDKFLREHKASNFKSAIPLDLQQSKKSGRNLRDEWESQLSIRYDLKKPIATENKERISVWIIYWPFSLIWSLIHDFIQRLWEQFVIRFQKFYQGIADRAYKKLEAHLPPAKDDE